MKIESSDKDLLINNTETFSDEEEITLDISEDLNDLTINNSIFKNCYFIDFSNKLEFKNCIFINCFFEYNSRVNIDECLIEDGILFFDCNEINIKNSKVYLDNDKNYNFYISCCDTVNIDECHIRGYERYGCLDISSIDEFKMSNSNISSFDYIIKAKGSNVYLENCVFKDVNEVFGLLTTKLYLTDLDLENYNSFCSGKKYNIEAENTPEATIDQL